jgi:hypothetical protein
MAHGGLWRRALGRPSRHTPASDAAASITNLEPDLLSFDHLHPLQWGRPSMVDR